MRPSGVAGWVARSALLSGLLGSVVALFLVAACPGLGATACSWYTGQAPPRLYGLHMDLTYDGDAARRERAIANAGSIGAEVARNSLLWSHVEQERGRRDWSRTDAVVEGLVEAGIEPMFVVYGSPAWANGMSGVPDASLHVPTDPERFEAWVDSYADFMAEAAARYSQHVKKWELGNEPNLPFFWLPEPNVAQYVTFYTRLRQEIMRANPEAQVAVGGLAGISATGEGIPTGLQFLKGMVSRGAELDVVSLHPYVSEDRAPFSNRRWQNNFSDIKRVRDYLMDISKPIPIWVTEWGWSSADVGMERQADYVAQSLKMIEEDYPYVTVATLFLDYDRPPQYHHGLFDESLRPKPAAERFEEFMTQESTSSP